MDKEQTRRLEERKSMVKAWINDNFELDKIKIEDFPLFYAGFKIIDQNNGEMIVYYDLMTESVKYKF